MNSINFKGLYLGMDKKPKNPKNSNIHGTLPPQLENKIPQNKLQELADVSDERDLDIYIFSEGKKLAYGFKFKESETFSVKGAPSGGNFIERFKIFAKDFFRVEI